MERAVSRVDCPHMIIGDIHYYLRNKKVPARFDQLLLNKSSWYKKIGDKIKALRISEPAVQTAPFYLNWFRNYFTLNEMIASEGFLTSLFFHLIFFIQTIIIHLFFDELRKNW